MKKKMKLIANDGYEHQTTLNKIYEVEWVPGIFEGRPYYKFVDNDGKVTHCHIYRFEEIKKPLKPD